jgi:MoaA/NifB/PqqE/SkfB family radical SAM enzyme
MRIGRVLQQWGSGRETLPSYLILGTTNRCNAKCGTCFYSGHLNRNGEKEMRFDEYERALEELGTISTAVLSGGEPSLCPDLARIVRLLYTRHRAGSITMPTNALLPERIESAVEAAFESRRSARQDFNVNLSLDHLFERHDRIRGVPGNFDRLRETYARLARLRRRSSGFRLNLHTVLASFNAEDLEEITAWVRQNLPEIDFHSFELLRPPYPDPSIRGLTAGEYERCLPILESYWNSFRRYPRVLRALKTASRSAELETLRREAMVYPCFAGSVSGVLTAEGELALCEGRWGIGNIRDFDYSFSKAWFSAKARAMRARIERRECWCTHSCFMASSLPFSAKGVALLLRRALSKVPERS